MQLEPPSPPSSQTFRAWGPLTPGLVAFEAFCRVALLPFPYTALRPHDNEIWWIGFVRLNADNESKKHFISYLAKDKGICTTPCPYR